MTTKPAKTIAILGSTGSIGGSTLRGVDAFPEHFHISSLAAGNNLKALAHQIQHCQPKRVCVPSQGHAESLRGLVNPSELEILVGETGLCEMATQPDIDTVVVATSGLVGLPATLAALKAGKQVALANKETLVAAGRIVMKLAKPGQLLPVDSEHAAVFQCLQGVRHDQLRRIILTASGGPFLHRNLETFQTITKAEALAHPTWSMGRKISIDSATLMNKTLELIEARWLFQVRPEQLEAVIHPQSIVHGMVELIDGSQLCQYGATDMLGPILFALSYPERLPTKEKGLTVARSGPWEFYPVDDSRFPSMALAEEALRRKDSFRVALNAADELAVHAFLAGRIDFVDIVSSCEETCLRFVQAEGDENLHDLDAVRQANQAARRIAQAVLDERTR